MYAISSVVRASLNRTIVTASMESLIEKLYGALDNRDTEKAGNCLADEVFAEDGIIDGPVRYRGTEGIRHSRDRAWISISSRKHEILKIYSQAHNSDAMIKTRDLMLLGRVTAVLVNEKSIQLLFTSRLMFVDIDTGPRVSSYQVWMDPTPIMKALQAGEESMQNET
ncbi:hypothetical protein F5884DRAFT_810516 [Xylogone sp. PMI_703]|nr:hypothetical protein F5884DRAFT_810516 [Xylogone sp. PMI_703]